MPTGQQQGQGDFKEYTSGQSDATTWLPSGSGNADWIQSIGAGTVVVTTEKGNSRTFTTDAAERAAVLDGPFSARRSGEPRTKPRLPNTSSIVGNRA